MAFKNKAHVTFSNVKVKVTNRNIIKQIYTVE